MNNSGEHNVLVGIIALQLDFIKRDELIEALSVWVLNKSRSLSDILSDQGALTKDTEPLLQALVKKHIELHDDNVEESLASLTVDGSLAKEFSSMRDPDVDATISVFARRIDEFDSSELSDSKLNAAMGAVVSLGHMSNLSSSIRAASDRYDVIKPHAKGGLGEVSLAKDKELNREVAVKLLQDRFADDPINRERFVAEAEITGSLEHPGIVPVYGLGASSDGRPFYAMRFIRGDSLRDAAAKFHKTQFENRGERRLELRGLLARFIDVCEAIEYAHSRGVLHRDLKPGNIMIGRFGETLVVDWGLAKSIGRDESHAGADEPTLHPSTGSGSSRTELGSAVGTPSYMSPEQAAGRIDELGSASDVYGLGATLYFVLTGQPPVEGSSTAEILERVKQSDFTPPRQVNQKVARALEAICLKAMALESVRRYASPHELAEDVQRWLADTHVEAYQEHVIERASRWIRTHTTLVAAAAILGIILIGASLALAYTSDHSKRRIAEEKERADEARLVAERNFGHALDAVEQMLTHVASQRLLGVPYMSEVRRDLLEDAIAFYQETLTEDEQNLPSVKLRIAHTYRILGRCEHILGNHEQAEEYFEKDWNILQSLRESDLSPVEINFAAAKNRVELGHVLSFTEENERGMETCAQGIEFINLMPTNLHDDPQVINMHGSLYEARGNIRSKLGMIEGSLEDYKRAEQLYTKLFDQFPDDEDTLYKLQALNHNLAFIYTTAADPASAEPLYRRALEYQEQLHALVGDRPWTLADHANTLMRFGANISVRGDLDAAIESILRAQEIFEELYRLYPAESKYRSQYAASAHNLGDMYALRSSVDLALTNFQLSIDLLQPIHDAGELTVGEMSDLATSHMRAGGIYQVQGRLQDARQSLQTSQELYKQLTDSAPSVMVYRLSLAGSYHNLAQIEMQLGELDDAEVGFRKSIDELNRMEEEFESNSKLLSDRANSWMMLAHLLGLKDRYEDSLDAFERAQQEFASLFAEQPENVVMVQQYAASHHNWADLMVLLGENEKAVEGYHESIRIVDSVAPERLSIPLMSDVGNSWLRLAVLQTKLKNFDDADAAFAEAQNRFGYVVSQAPGVPRFHALKAAAAHNHAELLFKFDRLDDAHEAFLKSIEILEPLTNGLPEVAQFHRDLANSYLRLAMTLDQLERFDEMSEVMLKAHRNCQRMENQFPLDSSIQYAIGLTRVHQGFFNNDAIESEKAADVLAAQTHDLSNVYNAACLNALTLQKIINGELDADESTTSRLKESAFERLEQCLGAPFVTAEMLQTDEDLNSIRADPEFQILVEQLKANEKDSESGGPNDAPDANEPDANEPEETEPEETEPDNT